MQNLRIITKIIMHFSIPKGNVHPTWKPSVNKPTHSISIPLENTTDPEIAFPSYRFADVCLPLIMHFCSILNRFLSLSALMPFQRFNFIRSFVSAWSSFLLRRLLFLLIIPAGKPSCSSIFTLQSSADLEINFPGPSYISSTDKMRRDKIRRKSMKHFAKQLER